MEERICEICGRPLATQEEIERGCHEACSLNFAGSVLHTEGIPPDIDDMI